MSDKQLESQEGLKPLRAPEHLSPLVFQPPLESQEGLKHTQSPLLRQALAS